MNKNIPLWFYLGLVVIFCLSLLLMIDLANRSFEASAERTLCTCPCCEEGL